VFDALTEGAGGDSKNSIIGMMAKAAALYFSGGTSAASGATSYAYTDVGPVVGRPLAEGGYVTGPSHAGGGVPAELEGGEYVTRVSQTERWLPLLQAINTGLLDRLMISPPHRGYRFAEGGMVPAAAAGAMTNNIQIKIDAGSGEANVNGDTKKATQLGRLITSVVQSELIKQKLPGGLLS